jgi:glycerophosphoryl diester phosphodiesterase
VLNFYSIVFCFLLFSCSVEVAAPEIQCRVDKNTLILGHKGSGIEGHFWNVNFPENSLKAIKNAFNQLDGAECDIQMSNDSTLWVFHDFEVNAPSLISIAKLSDKELRLISKDYYNGRIIPLDQLLVALNLPDFKSKTLVLDLKLLMDEKANQLFSNTDDFIRRVIHELNRLKQKIDFKLRAEVYKNYEYDLFRELSKIPVALVCNSEDLRSHYQEGIVSFSTAIDSKLCSVSKQGNRLFNLGLWNANTVDEMLGAANLHPVYILSDNIPLARFFLKAKRSLISKDDLIIAESERILTQERTDLFHYRLTEKDAVFLFRFKARVKDSNEKFKLVFWVQNDQNESVLWEEYPLENENLIYQVIDSKIMKQESSTTVNISILNNQKKPYELHDFSLEKLYFNE